MKNLYFLILATLFFSCEEPKYTHIGQEIIDGKVSKTQDGFVGGITTYPKIWVQTPTTTQEVEIPFEYKDRWRVGDSCFLIIEKYKENESK